MARGSLPRIIRDPPIMLLQRRSAAASPGTSRRNINTLRSIERMHQQESPISSLSPTRRSQSVSPEKGPHEQGVPLSPGRGSISPLPLGAESPQDDAGSPGRSAASPDAGRGEALEQRPSDEEKPWKIRGSKTEAVSEPNQKQRAKKRAQFIDDRPIYKEHDPAVRCALFAHDVRT